jgi:hypothetical protein
MRLLKLARLASTRLLGSATARTTHRQKRVALVIAATADLAQLALAPLFAGGALSPLDDTLDVIIAGLLLLTLGRSWRIAVALGLELLPGMALFPIWTAVVATLPAQPNESPVLVPPASR